MAKRKTIPRDISWLSFNHRVLQEAQDDTVPLKERIRFLGIYSNNADEFFRVRVATLRRMLELGSKGGMHLELDPEAILQDIQDKMASLQEDFEKAWKDVRKEMARQHIFLVDEKKLSAAQKSFVLDYFNEQVRSYIVPLMIQDIREFPALSDKGLYLACKMSGKEGERKKSFALVSVPTKHISRFLILPSKGNNRYIILLEDIIRLALPTIFSYFGYEQFSSHIIKITRDAEIDIDNDMSTSLMQKIEKGLKNRKRGKPVRFIYDKEIDPSLLAFLVKKMGLSKKDHLVGGSRIHNFKDFMDFPDVFAAAGSRKQPFVHPQLRRAVSISRVILKRDVLLNFPYHSFESVIDMLREAAIDPEVTAIKITCYRLAPRSKIINALINARRNGKEVTVMMELRARFDEEANLQWKKELEEAGIRVLIGFPNMKVHAKLCLIRKKSGNRTIHYGFAGTGNLNERTARIYGDHLLMTSDRGIMADVNRIFTFLEKPSASTALLRSCKTLLVSPLFMRRKLISLVNREIRNARKKKPASILLKLNSLSDETLIHRLCEAAKAGVEIRMVIRGIMCMLSEQKKFRKPVQAISIVDEYLEHARVMIFHNRGKEEVFISSADWMVRNLDHRIEAACPIAEEGIKAELKEMLQIQLKDNVKARILDNDLSNTYVNPRNKAKVRAQVAIYNYLKRKSRQSPES